MILKTVVDIGLLNAKRELVTVICDNLVKLNVHIYVLYKLLIVVLKLLTYSYVKLICRNETGN